MKKSLLWLVILHFLFISACQTQAEEAKISTLVELPQQTAPTPIVIVTKTPTTTSTPKQPSPITKSTETILFPFHLVDRLHPITKEEIKTSVLPNLINFHQAWSAQKEGIKVLNTDLMVNKLCLDDLIALISASESTNLDLYLRSGYRSLEAQQIVLNAESGNLTLVQPVGASQHHTGLAVDFTFGKPTRKVDRDFANSPESTWLETHAVEYGFVPSYIAGHDGITNEPWHYYYLGKDLAKQYQKELKEGAIKDVFDFYSLHQPTP